LSYAPLASDWTAYHTPESVRREFVPKAIEWRPLLDKPSEPHPLLNAAMDEALTRIALVSDGAVTRFGAEWINGRRVADTPSSDLATTLEQLGTAYMLCWTHRSRLAVIKEARAEAKRLRYGPERSKVQGTKEWREKIANDPRPCGVLASVYGVSATTVKRIKKDAGTSAPRGRPKRSTA
jgi:hypothetical protein